MTPLLPQIQSTVEKLQALPILLLFMCVVPLFLLAATRKIYPHKPLIVLAFVPCLLTVLLLIRQDVLPLILAVDLSIVVVVACDAWTIPTQKSFTLQRKAQRIASLGKSHRVTLTVVNHQQREARVWICDGIPQEFQAGPNEFHVRIPGRSRCVLTYDLRPSRRGAYRLDNVYVKARSRLAFWTRILRYPLATTIHVYPDMKQLGEYALLARTNRLSLMGVRRTRKIGQDNEFERLRDYTVDDNYKHIDWRSTARRRKLTVKDFQTSQSQRVIFLVDCGRMMTNDADGLSLLDHSLNAVLMLSYVALQQGDAVGMLAFSDEIHSYVPPKGGMSQMNHLLHATFDRFPRLVESRFEEAFMYLATRCPKRCLVILITNVIDDVNSVQIHRYLSTFAGRHLPLGVLLRDHRLFDAAEIISADRNDLFRAAAAAEILSWRHQVLRDMEHNGVLALDVFPENMTAPLVNRYLEIKARHLL